MRTLQHPDLVNVLIVCLEVVLFLLAVLLVPMALPG